MMPNVKEKTYRFPARFARLLLSPITKNAMTFAAMFSLLLISGWFTLSKHATAADITAEVLEFFADVYVLCAALVLVPHAVRRWVRPAVAVAIYAVALADLYCLWKFGSPLTPTMLLLVGETNAREASEFLRSYLSSDVLFSPLGWILALMLIHTLVATRGLWMRLFRKNAAPLASSEAARPRAKSCERVDLIAGACVAALLGWSTVATWHNRAETVRLLTAPNVGVVEHIFTEKGHATLCTPIDRLVFSIYSNHLAAKQIDQCLAAAEAAQAVCPEAKSPTIVLIIGESYAKHHAELYGYNLRTTPRQQEMARSGMLTPLSDVVSPWNLTSFVFKNILSTHVVGDEGEWCDVPLFPQLFRLAGYRVTFLTNQFLPQAKEAIYDFSGGFFLNNPQLAPKLFDLRNTQTHRFDEGLLADYDRLLAADSIRLEERNLVIFHLLGQHMAYRQRCLDSRRVFGPEAYEKSRPDLDLKHRQMLANYDNAVRYNDSIVEAITRRFENEEAIVVYVPDHGEEIYEPGRDFICRNHSAAVDWSLAHYEFEIPFWIWTSRRYAAAHPDVLAAIRAAKDKPFMTDALPHLLLGLAGISSDSYRPDADLLSPAYNANRRRILKASADYDKLRNAHDAKQ